MTSAGLFAGKDFRFVSGEALLIGACKQVYGCFGWSATCIYQPGSSRSTIGREWWPEYLCAFTNLIFAMPNFSQTLPVDGELLDFCFSLIHRPGGARYWVAVSRAEQYVTSFYFEKDYKGAWKLSDRYQTAPYWVRAMELLLAAAIAAHLASTDVQRKELL